MKINWPALLEFLKEPSTIKGIITLCGVLGVVVDQSQIVALVAGFGTLYGLVNIFYDRNKRKPPESIQQAPPPVQ